MQTFSDTKKRDIMNAANDRQFYLKVGNQKYAAKLAGCKLDFPFITANASGVCSQISWRLAERISKGETNIITK